MKNIFYDTIEDVRRPIFYDSLLIDAEFRMKVAFWPSGTITCDASQHLSKRKTSENHRVNIEKHLEFI